MRENSIKTKTTIFPTLIEALASLKSGECLYTNSWFILVPIEVAYDSKGNATSVRTDRVVPEARDRIRIKYLKPTKKYKGAYIHVKEEETTAGSDGAENVYRLFFFNWREINEFKEDLISSIKENNGVFKKPLEEAVVLGLGELDEYKDKDWFSIGVYSQIFRNEGVKRVNFSLDLLHKIIEESLEQSPWKEELLRHRVANKESSRPLPTESLEEGEYEEIKRLGVEIYSENKEDLLLQKESIMRFFKSVSSVREWRERTVIPLLDKKIGEERVGRLVGKVWERGKVFGVDNGGMFDIDYLMKEKIKQGVKIDEIIPNLYGELVVEIGLDGDEVELVAIPVGVKEVLSKPTKVEKVDKEGKKKVEVMREVEKREVRFLIFLKAKVKDKYLRWSEVLSSKYKLFQEIRYSLNENRKVMRIKSSSEHPSLGVLEEVKDGEKVVIVDTNIDLVDVSIEDKRDFYRVPEIYNISYKAGSLKIETFVMLKEGENGISIYDLRIKNNKPETEYIKIFMKNPITKRDNDNKDDCTDDNLRTSTLEQVEGLIKIFEEEKNRRKKGLVKGKGVFLDLGVILKRVKEVLESREMASSLKCVALDKYLNIYDYLENLKEGKLLEEVVKEMEKLKYENMPRNRDDVIIVPRYQNELCLEVGNLKEKITMFKYKKEGYLQALLNNSLRHIEKRVLTSSKRPKEAHIVEKAAIETMGIVVSALLAPERSLPTMSNALYDKQTSWINKTYANVFDLISLGGYARNHGGDSLSIPYWEKVEGLESLARSNEVVKKMIGVRVSVDMIEKIIARITKNKGEDVVSIITDSSILEVEEGRVLELYLKTKSKNKFLSIGLD